MLFLLHCQQPPSASAPPFRRRPRVSVSASVAVAVAVAAAAPLSVRVTGAGGGRRGRKAVVAMASAADARLAGIASSIRVIPDFPKPERVGAKVVECACVIELPELKGRDKLGDRPVFVLVEADA